MGLGTSTVRVGVVSQPSCGPDLPGPRPTHLPPDYHRRGCHTLLRHPIANLVPAGSVAPEGVSLAHRVRFWRFRTGTGISTRCPSTTPLGLALGPDLPWADEPSPGTLGQSAEGFLPPLSLLMPAFSLDTPPRLGYPAASPAYRRSPTQCAGFRLSGTLSQLRYMA